jgi:hypothetical protein
MSRWMLPYIAAFGTLGLLGNRGKAMATPIVDRLIPSSAARFGGFPRLVILSLCPADARFDPVSFEFPSIIDYR